MAGYTSKSKAMAPTFGPSLNYMYGPWTSVKEAEDAFVEAGYVDDDDKLLVYEGTIICIKNATTLTRYIWNGAAWANLSNADSAFTNMKLEWDHPEYLEDAANHGGSYRLKKISFFVRGSYNGCNAQLYVKSSTEKGAGTLVKDFSSGTPLYDGLYEFDVEEDVAMPLPDKVDGEQTVSYAYYYFTLKATDANGKDVSAISTVKVCVNSSELVIEGFTMHTRAVNSATDYTYPEITFDSVSAVASYTKALYQVKVSYSGVADAGKWRVRRLPYGGGTPIIIADNLTISADGILQIAPPVDLKFESGITYMFEVSCESGGSRKYSQRMKILFCAPMKYEMIGDADKDCAQDIIDIIKNEK